MHIICVVRTSTIFFHICIRTAIIFVNYVPTPSFNTYFSVNKIIVITIQLQIIKSVAAAYDFSQTPQRTNKKSRLKNDP